MKSNKINKKLLNISILLLALILLLSTITYAKPFTEVFRSGLIQINDFFEKEQYKPYAKAIDFFFFSLLFIAIYMMGARYAFKEVKRPEQVIVILLGLMTAFLLVLGGFSATIVLPYIQWILYILLFMLYWWLLSGIKNKFWRFVLALLLTLLTIGLFQGLFSSLTTPEVSGSRLSDFFKSFGKSFEGIDFGGIQPGVPSWLSDLYGAPTPVTTPSGIEAVTTTTKPSGGAAATTPAKGFSWSYIIIPLLIALALATGIRYRGKIAGLLRRGERTASGQPAAAAEQTKEETIDDLIKEITDAINNKLDVLNKIRKIMKEKEQRAQTVQGFLDLYHKKIYDDAFYLDPQHEAYQNLMREHREVTEILEIERALEKDLVDLMNVEDELIGKSALPLGNWQREKFSGRLIEVTSIKTQKEWYGKAFIWYWYVKKLQKYIEEEYTARLVQGRDLVQGREPEYQRPELAIPKGIPDFYGRIFGALENSFKQLKDENKGLLYTIKKQIVQYYVWTKEAERRETTIKLLNDSKQLEQWLKKGWATRWHDIKNKQGDKLVRVFVKEKKMFMGTSNEPGLFKNLHWQLRYLQHIKALLEALKSERVSMTQLQELMVDKRVEDKWVDVTKEAKRQPGIQLNVLYSVHTRIQEGIGSFKVGCYVNGRRVGNIKPVAAKHDEVRFTFEEIGINNPGTYRITFVCISMAEKVYERRDMKNIRIYVGGPAAVPIVPTPAAPAVTSAPTAPPYVHTPLTPAQTQPSQTPEKTITDLVNEYNRALQEKE